MILYHFKVCRRVATLKLDFDAGRWRLEDGLYHVLCRFLCHVCLVVVHILSSHLAIDTTGITTQSRHHHVQAGEIAEYALFRPELSSQHIHNVLHFIGRGYLFRCNILEHR